jgi:hypothetical protein
MDAFLCTPAVCGEVLTNETLHNLQGIFRR